MILEIDWGNTRFKWRLRDESATLAANASPAADRGAIKGALSALVRPKAVHIVSVRPPAEEQWLRGWLEDVWQVTPCFATPRARWAGVRNGYSSPETLGADRWVALLAAWHRIQAPFVVVQAGTAMTVDLVDGEGQHLGGYIAPGWRLMRHSLFSETARVRVARDRPVSSGMTPGRDTEEAVCSALSSMAVSLVRAALAQMEGGRSTIFMAGGDAEWLSPHFPESVLWPDIVLDGLIVACSGGRAE